MTPTDGDFGTLTATRRHRSFYLYGELGRVGDAFCRRHGSSPIGALA